MATFSDNPTRDNGLTITPAAPSTAKHYFSTIVQRCNKCGELIDVPIEVAHDGAMYVSITKSEDVPSCTRAKGKAGR